MNGTEERIIPAFGDKFTISDILELCHNGFNGQTELLITATHAIVGPHRDAYLNECYPIEISTSQGARSMGHCSDFVQYIYYGGARLTGGHQSDTFAFKGANCPKSMFLHGEYPISDLIYQNSTINLWMPNIEQINKEQLALIPHFKHILCKVKITCIAFDKYLKAHDLKSPTTKFMSHSSPDTQESAIEVLGENHNIKQDFNRFIHTYGHSGRKSTQEVIFCWMRNPFWPKLTVLGNHDYETWVKQIPGLKWATNIEIQSRVSIRELRELQVSRGVHICPSSQEGYGHYINEARALGALVVTTNHPPMNEFVEDGITGILVDHKEPKPEEYQGMAEYFVSPAGVSIENVCDGIKRVMKLTKSERGAMGKKARKRYDEDTDLMASNIRELVKDWK
ncbi:hypothetical protein HDU79_010536 [Rhizoclosmatium sp. JEL0117]|nr:hypothetical protein HDU79_010536 [Rhizoclosmatium sp. JEL0117]